MSSSVHNCDLDGAFSYGYLVPDSSFRLRRGIFDIRWNDLRRRGDVEGGGNDEEQTQSRERERLTRRVSSFEDRNESAGINTTRTRISKPHDNYMSKSGRRRYACGQGKEIGRFSSGASSGIFSRDLSAFPSLIAPVSPFPLPLPPVMINAKDMPSWRALKRTFTMLSYKPSYVRPYLMIAP